MNTQEVNLLERCKSVLIELPFDSGALLKDLEAAIAAERSKEVCVRRFKVVEGELYERSRDEDQTFGMWREAKIDDGAILYTSPQPLKPLSRGELITLAAQFANFDNEDFDKILEPLARAIEAKQGVGK